MRQWKFLMLLVLGGIGAQLDAQDYNIGIRAGLNYGKFLGPVESDVVEKFSISSGFHFGINFQYNFSDFLGLRGEVLYQQNGSKYKYEGQGFYNFPLSNAIDQPTGLFQTVTDLSRINIEVSNGGVSLPVTVHIRTLEKWEFFGGLYTNFIFSSIGSGKWLFGPENDLVEHSFEQGLNYNYRSDEARQSNLFAQTIRLSANGNDAIVTSLAGAYYNYSTKVANLYKTIDYGAIFGMSYYLNKSLFLSVRAEYGLRDITRNNVDHSYRNVNPDGSLIFEEDYDRNLNFALSIGFKF